MNKDAAVSPRAIAMTEEEKNLIKLIREMKNGELRVIVSKGSPVNAELIQRNIEL
jgi:hypothetical protein